MVRNVYDVCGYVHGNSVDLSVCIRDRCGIGVDGLCRYPNGYLIGSCVIAWHMFYFTKACLFSLDVSLESLVCVCIVLDDLVHSVVQVPIYAIYALMISAVFLSWLGISVIGPRLVCLAWFCA